MTAAKSGRQRGIDAASGMTESASPVASGALHFTVRGRVQGVGFRYAAKLEAGRLGLSGWVANRPNGEVEAVAQGAPESLAQFEAWLRVGPVYARVDGVDRAEAAVAAAGPAGDFRIRV